jgi:hypothetical protein
MAKERTNMDLNKSIECRGLRMTLKLKRLMLQGNLKEKKKIKGEIER